MSVTSSPSTAAASDRLAKAMGAARVPKDDSAVPTPATTKSKGTASSKGASAAPDADAHEHSHSIVAPGAKSSTERSITRGSTDSTRAASRGANAAPGYAETGATAADEGARSVQSVAPGADTSAAGSAPYMPYDASSDAYAAQEAAGLTQAAPIPGTGDWSPDWQERFEKLQLAPADIAYLASAGYDWQTLDSIAVELESQPVLDPSAPPPASPEPGRDAGSVSSADGPTPDGADPSAVAPGQPGIDAAAGGSAWTPQWEQKFGQLMERMGMSKTEIDAQLQGVAGQPTTEEQLNEAYRQMEAGLGDFDDAWREKFTKLLDELKTPAKDKEQVLQQLAGGGLTEAQLTEAYTQMEASKPAWNEEWESKFKALEVPEDLLKQLKESGAPTEALEQQFKTMLDTKMKYQKDGRLEKLEDAKATPEEKWGVMLENKSGEEFDKLVEQIHSSHVSGWKRVASFAVNLIPGVYALQFVTGKDWVTGEKIDRSNPLNIVGAVASGFAGFTAVRSAVAGVQGLSAANAAAQATKAAAGGASLSNAVTGTSALSQGSFKAIEAAGLVSKFDKGLKFTDYLKSAIPIVNRFGEAGRLSAVGRGYTQGMQLAAGAAAMRNTAGGGVAIDKATKATVLGELRQGRSINDALTAAGRSGRAGDAAIDAANIARDYNRYGFLQGNVSGKFGLGNGSGNFTLNPFKNTNTIASTPGSNVFTLGRGVNFGSTGGLAQGLGAVRGANAIANPGLAAQAAQRAAAANQLMQNNGAIAGRITGVGGITNDVQRITTIEKTAEWANKLGVAGGSRFRTLFQLGGSNRAAVNASNIVERGAGGGYRAARYVGDAAGRLGGYAAFPIVGGAAVGLTGRQMQPGWEYLQNRGEIQAEEAKAREAADKEAKELERLYQEQHSGGGTGGSTDAQEGAATSGGAAPAPAGGGAASQPQVVGTSPTSGGQLVFDPSLGAVYDTTNGDVYDPNTGALVGNLNQAQAAGAAPATGATAPATATTGGGAAAQQVYVDPQTGYYVDPSTGLMADPATGNVYDPRTGAIVANVNQPAA